MSGGVDSSVSAALLKQAGYDVTGVFIKVWQPDWIECNWREERIEAMRVAAHLGIPFFTLDLEKEYKEGVIDYMIAEYAVGRTPNPDVMCNREVKFGAFWRWAKAKGADFIATGHYAQVKELRDKNKELRDTDKEGSGGRFSMLKGIDANKDQSYFLWTLTQEDLKHVMFPVGGMTKPEVRKLAQKFKLPNAYKKDSQGLCFMGKVDVKEFLAHYVEGNPAAKHGKVVDEVGKVIGKHPGALFFTIGERHGFSIDAAHKTPDDEPYYVIGKDVSNNYITVSNRIYLDTHSNKTGLNDGQPGILPGAVQSVRISKVNWIAGVPKVGRRLEARSRYRQALQSTIVASIEGAANASAVSGNGAKGIEAVIEFDQPQDTLTPGQSLVMYDGEVCVGGGVIENTRVQ